MPASINHYLWYSYSSNSHPHPPMLLCHTHAYKPANTDHNSLCERLRFYELRTGSLYVFFHFLKLTAFISTLKINVLTKPNIRTVFYSVIEVVLSVQYWGLSTSCSKIVEKINARKCGNTELLKQFSLRQHLLKIL